MAAFVTRRRLLVSALAQPWLNPLRLSGLAAVLGCRSKAADTELFVSAQGNAEGEYGLGWTTPDGHAQRLTVGFRGHDAVAHPLRAGRVVLVARHPGRELLELDLLEQRVVRRVACAEHHVLGGHACFSSDGNALFTAESDYEQGQGRIVVRDAEDYRLLAEFPSYGIGPHELLMMPDGHTLAVANGGLLTHPSRGREVLNLDTMASRLTFIASDSGERLQEYAVDEPKASIRHLSLGDGGELSVALQMQREASGHERLAPLAAIYDARNGLRVLAGPEGLLWECKDYMGSTRINSRSRIAGFTSPRGSIALFWHLDSRELVAYHRFHDVCGLCANRAQDLFVVSNSAGQIRCLDATTLEERQDRRLSLSGFAWDNHLHALPWTGDTKI